MLFHGAVSENVVSLLNFSIHVYVFKDCIDLHGKGNSVFKENRQMPIRSETQQTTTKTGLLLPL